MSEQQQPGPTARRASGQTAASAGNRRWYFAELHAIRGRDPERRAPWFLPDAPAGAAADGREPEATAGGHAGLALSGGGIRSAAVCLGLLQALHARGLLGSFGWMSTVSGGGYTGTGWLAHALNTRDFPFGGQEAPDTPMRCLRDHASYLMAPSLWGAAQAAGMLLRKLLANLALLAPLVLLLAAVQLLLSVLWEAHGWLPSRGELAAALAVLSLLAAASLFIEGRSGARSPGCRRWLDGMAARLLVLLLAVLALVALATAGQWMQVVKGWVAWALSLVGIDRPGAMTSMVGSLVALLGAGNLASRFKGPWATALLAGLGVLFLLALIALALILPPHLATIWPFNTGRQNWFLGLQMLVAGALLLQIVALVVDANALSLHGYYRDRLVDAFFPRNRLPKLSELTPAATGGPLPIINATVAGASGPDMRRRGRPAGPFTLTPLECGSAAQTYVATTDMEARDHGFDAAAAMALSAAAVSPQAGRHTGGSIAVFFKALFNARTGRWLPNPAVVAAMTAPPRANGWHALREMASFVPRKRDTSMLLVSDGGHWENLGVLSLVHRHCPVILAVDAEADPDWKFNGLGVATMLARLDAGTEVAVFTDTLVPQGGRSIDHMVEGTITYPGGATGLLLYAKSTLNGDEPPDVLAYAAANPAFPHETTADQFFSEAQFEAYRRLGQHIGETAVAPRLQALLAHGVAAPPLPPVP